MATYQIEARVLAKKRYSIDATSDISPYDLLLGWGPMSDTRILKQLRFSQSNRFGCWRYELEPPLSHAEITRNSSNTHIIPANDALRDRIADLKVGSVVRLEGELVEANHPRSARPWRSSLSRTDDGFGACEILFVRSLSER